MEWFKKNKKIVIGVLVVVILACIGVGAYLVSGNGEPKKANEENTEKTVEKQEDSEEVQDEEQATENVDTETVVDETTQTESSEVAEETSAETTQPSASTNNTTASSNSSNTTNKTPSGSTTSGNTTTSPSTNTSNATTTTPTTNQTYETFAEKIGVYTTKNLPSENPYNEFQCPAWIGVYSVGQSKTVNNEIKTKFKEAFGFDATAEVVCTYKGKYNVAGYSTAQDIYQYTIKDLTYDLLMDEFYVIKKKICDDGSPWVGFATPDPYDSELLQQLLEEKMNVFCEWTGYTTKEIYYEKDKFVALGLSDAGWMRTTDGQVVKVLYRYTRGISIPISAE